jgi:Cyclin, N-terminal domain
MREGRFTVTPLTIEAGGFGSPQGERKMALKNMSSSVDHLRVLLQMESEVYSPCEDYLAIIRSSAISPTDRVSETWRRKLCEWCYEVVDHFGFDREVVAIALNYLDRVVAIKVKSSQDPISKREFQLVAVTSLYVAIKLHGENETTDSPRRKLKIDAFVELSRGFFQVEIIEATESNILSALNWHVNPPTMLRFISTFLCLLPQWTPAEHPTPHANAEGGIYDVSRYFTELSVCVSNFAFNCKASVVAYASILCAIEALQRTVPIPYHVRVAFMNNIAEATGLLPEMEEVRRVREMLKELCPSMFEGDEIPQEFLFDRTSSYSSLSVEATHGDGKTSPICVVDGQEDSPRTRRKRSHSCVDDIPLARSSF